MVEGSDAKEQKKGMKRKMMKKCGDKRQIVKMTTGNYEPDDLMVRRREVGGGEQWERMTLKSLAEDGGIMDD